MRYLAFQDMDRTIYEILAGTLEYLKKKGVPVDPMTQEAFAWFEKLIQGQTVKGE